MNIQTFGFRSSLSRCFPWGRILTAVSTWRWVFYDRFKNDEIKISTFNVFIIGVRSNLVDRVRGFPLIGVSLAHYIRNFFLIRSNVVTLIGVSLAHSTRIVFLVRSNVVTRSNGKTSLIESSYKPLEKDKRESQNLRIILQVHSQFLRWPERSCHDFVNNTAPSRYGRSGEISEGSLII